MAEAQAVASPETGEETDEDLLTVGKALFELSVERESHNRIEALADLKFVRLREQWDKVDAIQREKDGRPSLTLDKLGAIVKRVVNDGRQNRPEITVHPVGSDANVETAEIFNGLIRNIEVISDADTAYDTGLDFAVTASFGYLKANTRYCDDTSFDQDVVIERVADPFMIYGDPHSVAADSSDWNDAFEAERMTLEAFKDQYPDAEPVDWSSAPYAGLKDPWRDGTDVVVVSWWHRSSVPKTIRALSDGSVVDEDVWAENEAAYQEQGVETVGERVVMGHRVEQRMMTGAEILERKPWPGRFIPVVPVYGDDIIVEGKRYLGSLVRPAKDGQRMYNYARSAETEAVALAPKSPFIGPKGAFAKDPEKWETANTENHAFLEYSGAVAPQRQAYAGPPAGWMTLAEAAAEDIKAAVGVYDASMGQGSPNDQSGRAILGLQRQSDTSTFNFVDNQNRAIRHLGRIIIDMIPHVYRTERVIRIITADGKPRSVPINQPVPMQGADGKPKPELGADGQPIIDPVTQQPVIATAIYDLTAGRYDLTVKAGPGYATRRQEAAAEMTEVVRVFPESAPVIAPRLAKMLDWPGAEEIGQELQALAQAKSQGDGGQAEQQAMMAKAQGEQQIAQQRAQADALADQAKAASDAQIARQRMQADIALQREKAQAEMELAHQRLEADIALQTRKAQLEADLQRQRFALEASMRQPLDPVVPGGAVG